MKPLLKRIAKGLARQTVGRLPQPASRLTGKLARDGGKPVRDTRLRPWPRYHDSNRLQWQNGIGASLRRVFTSGVEGLPQPLAKQFAEQWAEYCGCKYGLLLPHGTDALRIGLAAVLDHDGLALVGLDDLRTIAGSVLQLTRSINHVAPTGRIHRERMVRTLAPSVVSEMLFDRAGSQ